jgi:hypothetical protein
MLRQAYYGKPWSANTTAQWTDVLPGTPNPGDPRSRIGSGAGGLFEALKQSQEVAGTDVGHIFTGLEAFFHPTSSVTLQASVLGIDAGINVAMPNTEFATWGGDLGAAAGRSMINDIVGKKESMAESFRAEASDPDLEGDIDAYGVVTGGGGARGLAGLMTPPSGASSWPVSRILAEYFAGSARMAGARQSKYRDFVTGLGGTVAGNRITDRAALAGRLAPRVASFASMYFWAKYRAEKGTAVAIAGHIMEESVVDAQALSRATTVVNLFLNWLEARL